MRTGERRTKAGVKAARSAGPGTETRATLGAPYAWTSRRSCGRKQVSLQRSTLRCERVQVRRLCVCLQRRMVCCTRRHLRHAGRSEPTELGKDRRAARISRRKSLEAAVRQDRFRIVGAEACVENDNSVHRESLLSARAVQ